MNWNDCSRSCGGGHRVRYRTCSNPVPSGKGPYCVGQAAEVADCETQDCPGMYHIYARDQTSIY